REIGGTKKRGPMPSTTCSSRTASSSARTKVRAGLALAAGKATNGRSTEFMTEGNRNSNFENRESVKGQRGSHLNPSTVQRMKFVELHACSAFSFLRGGSFPEQLAEVAAELE